MLLTLLIFFISLVLAQDPQTNARVESTFKALMNEFQQDLNATAIHSARADYNKQYTVNTPASQLLSFEQIYSQYKAQSDELFKRYQPIAHQIIENAAYNKNLNYYIWNEQRKAWHLYGKQPPNPPVDGSAENSKMLRAELKSAWITLVTTSSVSQDVSSSIKMAFPNSQPVPQG